MLGFGRAFLAFFLIFNLALTNSIHATATPTPLNIREIKQEAKAKEKIYKKFERQMKKFQKLTGRVLKRSSEEKLQRIFKKNDLYQKSSIKSLGIVDQKINNAITLGIPLSDVLKEMTTPQFKAEARQVLETEIARVGALQVLKSMREYSDFNWCLAAKVVAGIVIVPAALTVAGSMLAIGFFPFYDPLIWAFVAAAAGGIGLTSLSSMAFNRSCQLRRK